MFIINPIPIAFVAVVIITFFVFVVGARRRQASTDREEMRITVLPKTSLGRWSVCFAIASPLSLVLLGVLTGFNPLGAGLNSILADVLKILLVGISGAAFVTGLISVRKRKERSVFVFVGMAIALWFGLGEIGWLFHFSE